MAQKELTPKQKSFALEYLKDKNGTQAAIRAGYSPKTACEQASRLLANVNVNSFIDSMLQKVNDKAEIDAVWLRKHLAEILEADIADIMSPNGSYLPIPEWPKIWRQMLSGVEVKELWDGYGEDRYKAGEIIKVKLIDRIRTIEVLGKHVDIQAFADRKIHEHVEPKSKLIQEARKRAAQESRIH
ncbi:MAG TPA: terminase small subunit [Anaerolineae bacterium]|nr:terminase small subunit [Anaerolineae bacterium]